MGNKDFFGADSFTYKVNDGELDSNPATVRITMTAVNDAPTLGDQALTVAEDTLLNGNPLATAADVDSPVLTARIIAGPANGTVTVNANGTFSYQANQDYFGADSFTYKVNDGDLDSGIATVRLTVTPVNDAPVAQSASYQVQKDGSVHLYFSALVSDVDGDSLSLAFAQPKYGTLTRNADGSYTYKPKRGYTVSDGKLATTAKISLTVGRSKGGHDDDDDDRDCHGKSASVVVKSDYRKEDDERDDDRDSRKQDYGYIVVRGGSTSAVNTSALTINWSSTATQTTELVQANWVSDFLGSSEKQRSLAQRTGLIVKVNG